MDGGALRWGTLLETLRVLRGWSREELAAASGVSAAAIALQEQGAVNPTRGVREKLEEALGVVGREPELEALGELRAWMLDPEGRYWTGRSEGAGEEAQRILKVALRLGLDHLERIEPSLEETESSADLPWPLLLVTLRTLRGWSQEELESASGLATGMISKQEAGRRKPSNAIREKIGDAFRVRERMWEAQFLLRELRAEMLHPRQRSPNPRVDEAGEETRRIMEAALVLGYEDLRIMEEEENIEGRFRPLGEEE
jgi:transcriptional regulator with XRE-family HTH domain